MTIGVALILVGIVFQVLITEAVTADGWSRTLTIAMAEPIDSANPYVCINDNSYVFVSFIYGSLTKPDENATPCPDLARSWWLMNGSYAASTGSDFSHLAITDPSDWPRGSIWEYNLTDNAFWSDGMPFNADDVVFTFNMQIGANFATYWSYQPYTRWIAQVEKIDDYKVRIFYADIDTGEPFPIAFGDNVYIPIMPAHVFASQPLSYIAMEWNGAPTIGTGPWIATQNLIDELVAQETVTLKKNPFYHFTDPEDGAEKGLGYVEGKDTQIDQIKLKFFSEETTLALAIRNGNADCGKIQPNTFLSWQQDEALPRSISLVSIVSSTDYSKQIVINDYEGAPGTLNVLRLDPAVQRAIAIATNKTWIKNNVYKGLAELGVGLISPANKRWYWEPDETPSTFNVTGAVYNSTSNKYDVAGIVYSYTKPMNKVMEYDVAEANRILNAAGYVWANESGMTVRKAGPLAAARMEALGFGNASTVLNKKLIFEHVVEIEVFEDKQVGDFIVSDWEKIGVWIATASGDHTSSLVNSATWNTLIYSYTFNTMQTYWSGDIDPNYLLYAPTTKSLEGWNEFGTTDPYYDDIYAKQAKALDFNERKHWTDECQKWQYLSGNIITTVYPKICFAINNHTWKNWGDWLTYPILAIDNFWGNPLFMMLEYQPDESAAGDSTVALIIVGAIAIILVAVIAVRATRKKREEQELTEEDKEETKK